MTIPAQQLERIKKRPEYLAVANTRRRWVTPSFILQAKPGEGDSHPRAGFTTSKKVGNAIARNKARRRLKEAARKIMPEKGSTGWDYVFIGRQAATDYPFTKMLSDIEWALAKLHKGADLQSNGKQKRR